MRDGQFREVLPIAHPSTTRLMDSSSSRPGLIDRFTALFTREPENREDLLALLHASFDRDLVDADALSIIEGALQVSDIQVRDVMVPRAQMDVVNVDDPMDSIAAFAIKTAHSRFPVVGEGKDDVIGILLAKDLLRFFAGMEFDLRDMLRPAVFVPESKRLNVLLREFRISRNHMALVVDEYGEVQGLITLEDILEEIVGQIADEHDVGDTSIRPQPDGTVNVDGTVAIRDLNREMDLGTVNPERLGETTEHLLFQHEGDLVGFGNVCKRQGETVGAHSCHGLTGVGGSAKTLTDLFQHTVADVVAIGIIDIGETDQIHQQQGDNRLRPFRGLNL